MKRKFEDIETPNPQKREREAESSPYIADKRAKHSHSRIFPNLRGMSQAQYPSINDLLEFLSLEDRESTIVVETDRPY